MYVEGDIAGYVGSVGTAIQVADALGVATGAADGYRASLAGSQVAAAVELADMQSAAGRATVHTYVGRGAYVAVAVRAAEHLVDGAVGDNQVGHAGAVAVAVGGRERGAVEAHVGRCAALAVTACKGAVDVATVYGDVCGGYRCSVAAAVEVLDAAAAAVDGDECCHHIVGGQVGCQVAAAVHALQGIYLVAATVGGGGSGAVDGYVH